MITIEQIYAATHDGLDIITYYYPDAAKVFPNWKKTKFKMRPGEGAASAALLRWKDKNGNDVWYVRDYGVHDHPVNPINLAMQEENIADFREILLLLANRYGVEERLTASVNRAEYRARPATPDEPDGRPIFELLPEIPEAHLRILGPKVERKHAEALHWYEARYIAYVKDRKVHEFYSTDTYPIFLRECAVTTPDGVKVFYKVYEPTNPKKEKRFRYLQEENKPTDYINGLEELKAAYRAHVKQQEEAYADGDGEGRPAPPPPTKLERCFICAGERDALCCRSRGEFPIWFNSETYDLRPPQMAEIKKYVEHVYNIPDIDETGVRRGSLLALRYLDLQTIWLPESMGQYKDNRGHGRKDLRDWMEIYPAMESWHKLVEQALPAKFWKESVNDKGRKEISIDTISLLYFLRLNGYATLHDDNAPGIINYIHVNGNIVRRVTAREIKLFIHRWAEENSLPRDVRNVLINSPKISSPSALDMLKEITLDFTDFTPTTQWFHFEDASFEVSANGAKRYTSKDVGGHYVWEENVLPHRVKLDEAPMFEISEEFDPNGQPRYDITVKDTRSPLFGYVINTSRIHWRREYEELGDMMEDDEFRDYVKYNRFNIGGPLLNEKEKKEQRDNLLSKIFTIGYMLHRFKDYSRAWAPQAMDNKIGDLDQCNGRSGKSFLFVALSHFMTTVKLSGRNPRLMDNPHVFDQVNQYTDMVLVDDCDKRFPMAQFYDTITSSLTVNPKNRPSFTIPFEDAPKFAFTTNYVPTDFDASTEARMLYLVFSDYYHQKSEDNDYRDTHSIRDDFGRTLYDARYPEELWNADINFLFLCLQFYLRASAAGAKLQPPMDNIKARKLKADMGENFEEWAGAYFAEFESGRLDRLIVRAEAFDDYMRHVGNPRFKLTVKTFTKQLKAFAQYCPYIHQLNPPELLNKSGRLLKRVNGVATDLIYLESEAAHNEGRPLNDKWDEGHPAGTSTSNEYARAMGAPF